MRSHVMPRTTLSGVSFSVHRGSAQRRDVHGHGRQGECEEVSCEEAGSHEDRDEDRDKDTDKDSHKDGKDSNKDSN